MSCNGWTNHQTWNVALWYGDLFADMANDQKLHGECLKDLVAEMEMEKIPESSLAADIMNEFLRKVDWESLADHYNDEVEIEEEDVMAW